jgi:hypothetical protein
MRTEAQLVASLDGRRTVKARSKPSTPRSPRFWRAPTEEAPTSEPGLREIVFRRAGANAPPAEEIGAETKASIGQGRANSPPEQKETVMRLTAKSLKVTAVLDVDQVAALEPPMGSKTAPFEITVEGRTVTGTFNAKSVRKAVAAANAGDVVVIVQGKLVGDILEEAGIVAQPKAPKAKPESDAA